MKFYASKSAIAIDNLGVNKLLVSRDFGFDKNRKN